MSSLSRNFGTSSPTLTAARRAPRTRRLVRSAALMCSISLAGLAAIVCTAERASAQSVIGEDITYARSGMKIGGSLIDGTYDFTFRLFDQQSGGNLIGEAITVTGVEVSGGKLPTQTLNFGVDAFNGDERWIDVRARASGGTYKSVGPRSEVLAVPYALSLPYLRTIEAGHSPNIVGGHPSNSVDGTYWGQTLCGGGVGGSANATTTYFASVVGGLSNTSSGYAAFTGGGTGNVSGGGNTVIGGGYFNTATGNAAVAAGGSTNVASGTASTVPGGKSNTASGHYSFAAGFRAKAAHLGSFVWADQTESDFYSFANNSFNVRASGGFFCYTSGSATTGAVMAPGSGAWSALSDRDSKANFEAIDGRDVLERVAALPISTWNYKAQDEAIRHIGPMAQDFKAAFGVGEDERHITSTDADGVLFAAVQGLHSEARQRDAEIERQRMELRELRESLAMKDAQMAEQARQMSAMRERMAQVERMIAAMGGAEGQR